MTGWQGSTPYQLNELEADGFVIMTDNASDHCR